MRLALLVLVASVGFCAELRPVALASADGALLALTADCHVLRLDGGKRGGEFALADAHFLQCLDMAAATQAGELRLFVVAAGSALANQAAQQGRPTNQTLESYDSKGKHLHSWKVGGAAAGASAVGVDSSHQTVYVASLIGGEIYRLELGGKQEVQYVLQIPGASRIRALAVDPARGRLFAGDAFDGRLYVVDLARRRAELLSQGFGEPSALAYDGRARKLYVADVARRKIWTIRVDMKTTAIATFSSVPFHEPLGLALDAAQNLWVCDRADRVIYGISPSGQVLQTVR